MKPLVLSLLLPFACKTTQSVSSSPVAAPEPAASMESPAAEQMGAATSEELAAADAEPAISECGAAVLQESQNAYTDCFAGDEQHGACETCGYNSNASAVKNANDCITCPEGFEISQFYGDCTGYCVPVGTAEKPLATALCRPATACVTGGPLPEPSPASPAEAEAAEREIPDGMSECGTTVLQESDKAYTDCFAGDEQHGACETCGYNSNASAVKNANDCITCPDGFEISKYYSDCTGFCVPEGTAQQPLSSAECRPVSECVVGAGAGTP